MTNNKKCLNIKTGIPKYTVMLVIAAIVLFSFVPEAGAISKKGILAEKLYMQGSYRSAAYECDRLFRAYGVSKFKNEIAYLAALSYLKLKNFTKAKQYFDYVANNASDQLLLNEAKIGLDFLSAKMPSAEPSRYSIQVGSFRDKRNAVRLFNRFKRRKYTVRIVEDKDDLVTAYKVKVGKFKSKADAVKFSRKLMKTGYQTAIVSY